MVLAGEAVDFSLYALRLEVELEHAVQRHLRVGIRPVQADTVHADAFRRDGHGLCGDFPRRHAKDFWTDERKLEWLEGGQVEFQRFVLFLEIRAAGEFNGIWDVVAVREARIPEVGYGDGLDQRALRPRDAAQVERDVHA